jgi:hypothetical protein
VAPATPKEIFELVLAGEPAETLVPGLRVLPDDERQALLCTVCLMRDEITANCGERAAETEAFLSAGCLFYINGKRTCSL